MKILITGATGLVGQAIQAQLKKDNMSYVFLTTSKEKVDGKKSFFWQPSANMIDANAFEGITHIINLAGASISEPWTTSHKEEVLSSRIDAINALSHFLKNNDHQVKHIVSASASGIYRSDLNTIYTEDSTAINSEFLGQVVQKWEQAMDTFKAMNLDVTILRIGVVFSNKGGALPKIIQPIKFFIGSLMGNGSQWMSWIALEDLADMFVFVINKNCLGIYNAVSPEPTTNKALTLAIAKQLNRLIIFPPIPKVLMKIVLGDRHVLLFDSQNVSSKKIENQGFKFKYFNLQSYLSSLFKST